jgi:hypothetical protein
MCVPTSVAQRQQQGRTTIGAPTRGRRDIDSSRRIRSWGRKFSDRLSDCRQQATCGNTAVAAFGNPAAAVAASDATTARTAIQRRVAHESDQRAPRLLPDSASPCRSGSCAGPQWHPSRNAPGTGRNPSDPISDTHMEFRYSAHHRPGARATLPSFSRHALSHTSLIRIPGRTDPAKLFDPVEQLGLRAVEGEGAIPHEPTHRARPIRDGRRARSAHVRRWTGSRRPITSIRFQHRARLQAASAGLAGGVHQRRVRLAAFAQRRSRISDGLPRPSPGATWERHSTCASSGGRIMHIRARRRHAAHSRIRAAFGSR